MGKALVIKGVNYLPNSLAPQIQRLSWIGMSDRNNSADFDDCPNGRYISSGITFNTNIRLSITFQTVSDRYSVMLAGSRYSNDTTIQAWLQGTQNGSQVQVFFGCQGMLGDLNYRTITVDLWDGEEHTIDICKERIIIDGSIYPWSHEATVKESSTAPIYLDCSSMSNGIVNTYAKGKVGQYDIPIPEAVKLKEIKIWSEQTDESSLVVDAVPAMQLSNGAVGLYNLVNGEFLLRNDGSTPVYGV